MPQLRSTGNRPASERSLNTNTNASGKLFNKDL
jgi:hypothetical protein